MELNEQQISPLNFEGSPSSSGDDDVMAALWWFYGQSAVVGRSDVFTTLVVTVPTSMLEAARDVLSQVPDTALFRNYDENAAAVGEWIAFSDYLKEVGVNRIRQAARQ